MDKWLIPGLQEEMSERRVKCFHTRMQGSFPRPLQSCQNDSRANMKGSY